MTKGLWASCIPSPAATSADEAAPDPRESSSLRNADLLIAAPF